MILLNSLSIDPQRDSIYKFLLSRGHAELYMDIGAASGEITQRIASNANLVIAVEPFPNNIRLFKARLAQFSNVKLLEKAASNRLGHTTLFVESTVMGNEQNWGDQIVYSSVGRISSSLMNKVASYARTVKAALLDRRGATIRRVSTTTVDSEVGENIVDFLKIDVQGAERQVLEGANKALSSNRIRLLYLEWSGDIGVEKILDQAHYVTFDSVYVGSGSTGVRNRFEEKGFKIMGEINLSTGQIGFEMAYRGDSSDIGKVLRELNRDGDWIQTDLIALPLADMNEYLAFIRLNN